MITVELAPEVLAVNSDFDEGRIDPETGYAIPDCDDIPGVDRKTGAGNSELRLDTDRAHLDGLFADDERVTDDMHKGWFDVHPSKLGNDFWDGATVTIRKLDKIDEDTGYKESGQVRFYAKWGDQRFGDYYGIIPYDLQTLTPNNLVTSGVNGKQGEGVYGSSATIPANAEFWMEGVRPGKITLEWRLQKGDIDVKYEQTFLVCTQQSKQKWIDQVYYQVKLQSTNLQAVLTDPKYGHSFAHPLAAFPIDLSQYDPSNGFFLPASRNYVYIQTVYYYRQLFAQYPEELYWAGMAKTAGAAVYAGMVDMNTWKTSVFVNDGDVDKILNDFMIRGNKDIFMDQAWVHHAYISSGIGALQYLKGQQEEDGTIDDPFTDYDGWEEIYQNVEDDDVKLLHDGNKKLLRREQEIVMQQLYDVMKDVWLDPGSDLEQFLATDIAGISYPPENADGEINIDEMFTINGRNPIHINGPMLRDVVPNGKLSNLNDRWTWIDNEQNGMLQIWLGTSKGVGGFTEADRRSFNAAVFWTHAQTYSQLPTLGNFHIKQFPPLW